MNLNCWQSHLSLFFALSMMSSTWAADVQTKLDSLALNADYRVSGAANPHSTVVLLLHGSMAHHKMDIISTLQDSLEEAEITSLAITLSLGQDDRKGMYGCEERHIHKLEDASTEIRHWVDWLAAKGHQRVVLMGHSLGANQISRYAKQVADPRVVALVLIAPPAHTKQDAELQYQKRTKKSLSEVLARLAKAQTEGGPITARVPLFLHCPDAEVSPASFTSYYLDSGLDTPSLWEHINIPTLLVMGSEDPTSVNLRPQAGSIPNHKLSDVLLVDGADHFFRDLYAEDIIDRVVVLIGALRATH